MEGCNYTTVTQQDGGWGKLDLPSSSSFRSPIAAFHWPNQLKQVGTASTEEAYRAVSQGLQKNSQLTLVTSSDFILRVMESHWGILIKGVICSTVGFEEISLAAL